MHIVLTLALRQLAGQAEMSAGGGGPHTLREYAASKAGQKNNNINASKRINRIRV